MFRINADEHARLTSSMAKVVELLNLQPGMTGPEVQAHVKELTKATKLSALKHMVNSAIVSAWLQRQTKVVVSRDVPDISCAPTRKKGGGTFLRCFPQSARTHAMRGPILT